MKTAVIIVLIAMVLVMFYILLVISSIRDMRDDIDQEEFIKRYVDNIKK